MSKICIFSAQYPPHMGGVENYTYHLARGLAEKGDQVVIVTSALDGLPESEMQAGVMVIRMPSISFMEGRCPILLPCRRTFRLHRILADQKFDLVLVNTRFYLLSLYGVILARSNDVRAVLLEHGCAHLNVHNSLGNAFLHAAEHCITALERLFCREYYGVSEACNQWLRHFHIRSSGTLHNAVDLNAIEKQDPASWRDLYQEYHIPKNAVVVAFTGRMVEEKGIFPLIESICDLHHRGLLLYLFLAGDGKALESVQTLASHYIIPLGRLDFREVICLLKQSDIFCLPSDSEGFSTSLLEAAACRCFLITSATGGAQELIPDETHGIILHDNSPSAIADALTQAYLAPNMRRIASEKVYRMLKSHYTWEIISNRLHHMAAEPAGPVSVDESGR